MPFEDIIGNQLRKLLANRIVITPHLLTHVSHVACNIAASNGMNIVLNNESQNAVNKMINEEMFLDTNEIINKSQIDNPNAAVFRLKFAKRHDTFRMESINL